VPDIRVGELGSLSHDWEQPIREQHMSDVIDKEMFVVAFRRTLEGVHSDSGNLKELSNEIESLTSGSIVKRAN
jgi:hypothetical protein